MVDALTATELVPIDLSQYAEGNCGIAYAWSFASPQPGAHVLINALMHGNELCGAVALDALLSRRVRPRRGRLTLCFANVAAYGRFDPSQPHASRFVEEDMNRVWSDEVLAGDRRSIELARARELLPLFDAADYLLDLHSMQTDTAALMLSGPGARGSALAAAIGAPEWVVADGGHVSGSRLIDRPRFVLGTEGAAAVLAECGQHWKHGTGAVAIELALRFLIATGALDPGDGAGLLPDTPLPPQRRVEVTHAITVISDTFHFLQPFLGLERIASAGTVIAMDGAVAIATPYDDCVLIMPSRNIKPGQTAVRLGRLVD